MQKKTKELFITLKALRPTIHGISNYYGIDWHSDKIIDYWYLEYPNEHLKFNSEINTPIANRMLEGLYPGINYIWKFSYMKEIIKKKKPIELYK